jgi:hypothetical protein
MRKFLVAAAAAPMLLLMPTAAQANVGTCYIVWFDAVTGCGASQACSDAADAELMLCLQREAVINE